MVFLWNENWRVRATVEKTTSAIILDYIDPQSEMRGHRQLFTR